MTFKILFLSLTLYSQFLLAQEVHEFYNGVRALGMGGAQIAVVDDETALLANPAGLGKLRDFYGTLLDPELDGGTNFVTMYNTSPFQSPFDPSQIANTLKAFKNTYYHLRGQIFPSLVVRNFGIGYYNRYLVDMKMNTAGTAVDTFYWDDAALLLGYNLRLWGGRIKIGVTGKLISRIEVNKQIAYPGNFSLQANASEGAAVGADAGFSLAAPWAWLPTVSVVARDVGGTQFTAGKNIRMTTATIPAPMLQDFDVALAVFPIHGNRVRSTFTIEEQKILAAAQSVDPARYLHVGWELNNSDLFFLRAGMNGHFWTAGLEIASERLQFQFATYGEDVGQGTIMDEDRRYVIKFSYRL